MPEPFETSSTHTYPDSGGRWVVAQDGDWVRSQIPGIDLVVYGIAEHLVAALMDRSNWNLIPNTDRSTVHGGPQRSVQWSRLDYRVLSRYRLYNPSIEVSRGCGSGCVYCAEASIPLSPMKPANNVVSEATDLVATYGGQSLNAYFETSYFRPTSHWIDDFRTAIDRAGLPFQWRTETRVDGLSPEHVAVLAKLGLLDLTYILEPQWQTARPAKNPVRKALCSHAPARA